MRKLKLFSLALMALFVTSAWGAPVIVQIGNAGNSAGNNVTLTNSAGYMKDGVTRRHLYVMSGGSSYSATDIQNSTGIDVLYGNEASTSTLFGKTSNLGPKLESQNKGHLQVAVETGDSIVVYWFYSSTFSGKTWTISKKKASDPVNGEKVVDISGVNLGTSKRTGCTGWKATLTDTVYFSFNNGIYVYAVKIISGCEDPNASIIKNTTGFIDDVIDLKFSSENTRPVVWNVKLGSEDAEENTDYQWVDGDFKPLTDGTFVVTATQNADGTHCEVEESVTLTIAEKNPVTSVSIEGPASGFIGYELTYTATAEGATSFKWYVDDEVQVGKTSNEFVYTGIKGEHFIVCEARNQFNKGEETETWVSSTPKAIAITKLYGELIKAKHDGTTTGATITGEVGGTVDKNTQTDGKLGGGHYFGIQLASGNYLPGDTLNINLSKVSTSENSTICIYADNAGSSVILETGAMGVVGDNKFVLPTAIEGKNILYIVRLDAAPNNKWNGFIDYMSVIRPLRYDVIFDAGEGTGSMSTLEYPATVQVTLPDCDFTAPADKTFDAWTTTDATISEGKFTMPAKDVTITATWKENGGGTALDNTEDEVKVVKVLRDGQLFIEKNGHVYNVFGACVK